MKDFCETERSRIHRWAKFQLPYTFKTIGVWAIAVVIALLIVIKFVDDPVWLKPLLHSLLIIAMLTVSLAKEKIEDELIVSLRALSYRWAFVMGVLYALIQPYINYAVDYVLGATTPELDKGYFPVLVFMLFVQLLSFYQLKRLS